MKVQAYIMNDFTGKDQKIGRCFIIEDTDEACLRHEAILQKKYVNQLENGDYIQIEEA